MRILDDVWTWLVRRATNRALARIRERHGMAVYQESLAALESAAAGRSEAASPVATSPDRGAIGDARLARNPPHLARAEERHDLKMIDDGASLLLGRSPALAARTHRWLSRQGWSCFFRPERAKHS